MYYLRFFMLCTILITHTNFGADIPNNSKTTKFASFFTHPYAYIVGAFSSLAACIGIGRHLYKRYIHSKKPTLAAWIARIEKEGIASQIDEGIQKEANQFLAIGYHNYITLKKAVSSSMLNDLQSYVEHNAYHQIALLLENDYFFDQEGKYDPNLIYSTFIEDPKPAQGTPRFEFFMQHGHCVGIHLMHYETFSPYDNTRYKHDGLYRTSLYYPRNQNDSEGGKIWVQRANALIHTKKRYDEFHTAWQQHNTQKTTPQQSPWDARLFTQLLTILNEHRCKGELKNKEYCLRTVRCEARDIVAAYKEYDCWFNHDGKTDAGVDYVSPKIIPEMCAQHKTIVQHNLLALLAHTPFTLEKLDEMKATLNQKTTAR